MRIKKFLLNHSEDSFFVSIGYIIYSVLYTINERLAYVVLKIFASLLFGLPGLTFSRYGYDNVYIMRFCYLVQERFRIEKLGLVPMEKRELHLCEGRIKVGFFGTLSTPNKDLFWNRPKNVDLYIYDVETCKECLAPWLKTFAKKYYRLSNIRAYSELVEEMNRDHLDILVHVGSFSDIKDVVFNQTNASKIVVYNTGTAISFNEKVDLDLMHQPQLYSRIKNNLFYCDILKKPFSNVRAMPINFVFNHRNIDMNSTIPLEERKHQLVFHGNLYKLDNQAVLKIIVDLLRSFPDYTFVYMGANQKPALEKIQRYFRKSGVLGQVKYMGNLSNTPDEMGNYKGNQMELFTIIRESRLYIDPWPIDGGNTVYQAYALGVPCVSLKMDMDQPIRKLDKSRTILELNGLVTDLGPIARTPKEYEQQCYQLLLNDQYAESVIQAQLRTAKEISGQKAYERFWTAVLSVVNK